MSDVGAVITLINMDEFGRGFPWTQECFWKSGQLGEEASHVSSTPPFLLVAPFPSVLLPSGNQDPWYGPIYSLLVNVGSSRNLARQHGNLNTSSRA